MSNQSLTFDPSLDKTCKPSSLTSKLEGTKHLVLQAAQSSTPMLLASNVQSGHLQHFKQLQLSQHKLQLKAQQSQAQTQTQSSALKLQQGIQIQPSKILQSSSLQQPTRMLQNRWVQQMKLSHSQQMLQSAAKLTQQSQSVGKLPAAQNSHKSPASTPPQKTASGLKGTATSGLTSIKSKPDTGPSSPIASLQSIDDKTIEHRT